MDPEKVAFLFGQPPEGADPDNPDDRVELLSREVAEDHPRHGAQVALRLAVADQIAHDEPPQVWRTAQRLLAEGRDRAAVMRQLVLALTPSLMNTVVGGAEFDLDAYLAALKRLPIPSGDECERTILHIVRNRGSIETDELDELVAQRLGVEAGDPVIKVLFVRPGVGVGVRDLRTGDVLDVRERAFSRQARLGGLVCARAVPDGETHQFIGGIFAVAPGTERAVLDLLDGRDGLALLTYVAELPESRSDLVADVGVLGDQMQSSAGR